MLHVTAAMEVSMGSTLLLMKKESRLRKEGLEYSLFQRW
jgi:hypothetical protein